MEDIRMELNALKDEFERFKKHYEDLLLNLDSDNIIEIDFGRTRLKNPLAIIGKLTTTALDDSGVATQAWVAVNFEPKAGV